MNTALINFDNHLKKDLLYRYANPDNKEQFKTIMNLTEFNEIKSIIGFYKNGIFYNKGFKFSNGIFEMDDFEFDNNDKIYFMCIVSDQAIQSYIMQYPIANYTIDSTNNTIILQLDNIHINNEYSIEGIFVNNVLYAYDEFEMLADDKIKFREDIKLEQSRDIIKLLIKRKDSTLL